MFYSHASLMFINATYIPLLCRFIRFQPLFSPLGASSNTTIDTLTLWIKWDAGEALDSKMVIAFITKVQLLLVYCKESVELDVRKENMVKQQTVVCAF